MHSAAATNLVQYPCALPVRAMALQSRCTQDASARRLAHPIVAETVQHHVPWLNNIRRGRLRVRLRSAAVGVPQQQAIENTAAAATSAQPSEQNSNFQWLSHWYPVHTLESIDSSRPHAVELLGKQLVLWKSGPDGSWNCMEDVCPHRLAPLSEGRLESDGTLQCSYHGWRFNSSGRCTEIPQAIDDKAKAVACSSSRSSVITYPVKEAYGLIWVWPTAGPAAAAQAAAEPLPVSKGMLAAWCEGRNKGTWYRRELPYSWDILIENLSDPAHLPFSHHNLTPTLKRSKGSLMPFKVIDIPQSNSSEDQAARPAYCFKHQPPLIAFEFPSALSPGGRVCFTPPSTVVYEYDFGPYKQQTDLVAVPAGPGRSVAFTYGLSTVPRIDNAAILKALFTNPKQLPMLLARAVYQWQPAFSAHLNMNKLFDQDNVFLHMQDRQLALRGKSNWSSDYYMPAPCDGGVVAARRWADQALQSPLPDQTGKGSKPASEVISLTKEEAAAPRLPPQQLNDRYSQHTKHCTICQKALQKLQKRLQTLKAVVGLLVSGVAGLVFGLVVPSLLGVGSAAVGNSLAVAGGAAAALGVISAIVSFVLVPGAVNKIQQFEYVQFSHADNH